MATQKPISTISYNSEAFLKEHLDEWVKAHIIQAYQYIKHIGEDGDKDHIHVRLEPNKKLDPMDLTEKLKEYTRDHVKPLGCRPWRFSKEEDWYLYVVHDPDYLALKYGGGEKGEKLPYDWRDIQTSDDYDLEIAFIRAKATLNHTAQNIADRIRNGNGALDLVLQGENVYTVSAVLRLLQTTDYQRLSQEYLDLKQRFDRLMSAVDDAGLTVVATDDGMLILENVEGRPSTSRPISSEGVDFYDA